MCASLCFILNIELCYSRLYFAAVVWRNIWSCVKMKHTLSKYLLAFGIVALAQCGTYIFSVENFYILLRNVCFIIRSEFLLNFLVKKKKNKNNCQNILCKINRNCCVKQKNTVFILFLNENSKDCEYLLEHFQTFNVKFSKLKCQTEAILLCDNKIIFVLFFFSGQTNLNVKNWIVSILLND